MDLVCSTADCSAPLRLAQLFTCLFLAILFLQSGIDKVIDRSGNLEWLTGHFAASPLAGLVPLMLTTVTITELLAGAICAIAVPAMLLGAIASTPERPAATTCASCHALPRTLGFSK